MADSLNLNININANQAIRMQKQLERSLKQSEQAMKNVRRTLKGVKEGLRGVGREEDKAGRKTRKLAGSFKTLGGVASRGFRNMGNAARSLLRPLGLVSGILGGITVGKAFRDFVEFDDMVGVLNATLRGTPEQMENVRKSIIAISAETGKAANDLADAMTQLLSSGFAPKTETFEADMKRNEQILKLTAQAARATDTTVRDMNDAFILGAQALGENVDSVEGVNRVFDLFSATLDQGIGTMSQYTGEFGKFATEAKAAGATSEEALAVFGVLTRTFEVPEAGTRALALFREINDAAKDSKRVAKTIGVKRGVIDELFFDPKTRTQRNFQEILKNLDEFVKKAPDEQTAKLMTAALFPETRGRAGFREVLKDLDQFREVLSGIEDAELGTGKLTQAKFDAATERFGSKFKTFTNQLQLLGIDVADGVVRAIQQITSGEVINFDDLIEDFAALRAAMKKTFPGAEKLVNLMENFIRFLKSDEGQQFLKRVGTAFVNIGTLIANLMKGMLDLFNSPFVQTILDWAANNPVIAISAAFIGQAALATAITSLVTNSVIGGFSAVSAAALGPFALILAGVIGTSLLAVDRKQELAADKDKKVKQLLGELTSEEQGRGFFSNVATAARDLGTDIVTAPFDVLSGTSGDSAVEKQNKQFAARMLGLFEKFKEQGIEPSPEFRKLMEDIVAERVTAKTQEFVSKTGHVSGRLRGEIIRDLQESGLGLRFQATEGEDFDVNRFNEFITGFSGQSFEDMKAARAEETNAVIETKNGVLQLGKSVTTLSSSMDGLSSKISNIELPTGPGGTGEKENSSTTQSLVKQ